MEKPFHKYKIDQYDKKSYENVLMGCGLQHITKESKYEILPFFDMERNIYFTADCIIDNRNELLGELSQEYGYNKDTADGMLIYGSYLKWGEDCAKHLRGIFSFAIYDGEKNVVLIYADQVFERCIYYYSEGNNIYFSTLIKPIVEALDGQIVVNEKFISDSLATYGLRGSLEPAYTMYKGIYKVEAGCYIKKTTEGCQSVRYWSPSDAANVPRFKSPEKSGEYCVRLLEDAVEDALRCDGNIAAALSSGLDSSTVCGIAASRLSEDNKVLNTYTFIPVSDYKYTGSDFYIADETVGVRLVADMHKNINPQFLDNDGSDAYKELDYFIDMLETPFKSIVNLPSINSIYKHAKQDQCKIVLFGQYGNVTVSQGSFQDAIYDKMSKFNITKTYRILTDFCNKFHISRKKLLKRLIKDFSICPVNKIKYRLKKNILEDTYVNQSFAIKNGSEKKLRRSYFNMKAASYSNIKDYHKYMYDLDILAQLGELNTKFGLINGVVLRDPTKDIRIIQFCSTLPMECFYNKGIERWLVRGNMKEYVPDTILKDIYHRGLQSADYLYKINKRWNVIMPDLKQHCLDPSIAQYINQQKIAEFFDTYKDGIDDNCNYVIDPILYISAISKFINKI